MWVQLIGVYISKKMFFVLVLLSISIINAQEQPNTYKKRVLESAEIDFLSSYYTQDGDNAAVTGGIGTEELTDFTPTIVVSVPLNDDDVLTVDAGVSAYTSASSSNVDPFDGDGVASPFIASTGASRKDELTTIVGTYSHSSDDRNTTWSANVSVANEYDYFSVGFGGNYTKLFNEKNTEISIKGNLFLDQWNAIYPSELRDNPAFVKFDDESRNSYSLGIGFSQIISKKLQGSIAIDVIQQKGLLSTPFQRILFADVTDVIVQEFTLGDDIERLPNSRFKVAAGGRLHYYMNEYFVIRTYYRYYKDDWGIDSHTASIEVPIKITDRFTVFPTYRFYQQTAANYFAPFNQHLSTEVFYTSDYDLSDFVANQYGFGISYTDIFAKTHVWKFGLKSIDLRFRQYQRNSGLTASIFSGGFNFVLE